MSCVVGATNRPAWLRQWAAEGGAEHGGGGERDLPGIPAHRLADGALDGGGERAGELPVATGAEGNRLGGQLGQFLAGEAGCIEAPLQLAKAARLGAEEDWRSSSRLLDAQPGHSARRQAIPRAAGGPRRASARWPFFPAGEASSAKEAAVLISAFVDLSSWCNR